MKCFHMVTVSYTGTMFTWLHIVSVFLFLLISLNVPIVLSEKISLIEDCSRLGSYIDCAGKQLTKVSNHLPSWADKLKLNKNLLTGIPYFTADNNLTELSLGHNRITSISGTALEKLSSLEVLELNNNNIDKIGVSDFPELPRLKSLNLNHNEITKIENDCFKGLINLTDLKINRNKITTLTVSPFQSLRSLINLELNRNSLTEITWTTFKGLESLRILDLRQNYIEDVLDGAFHKLVHLRELHLNNNKLATISKGWLYGLEALNRLNVSSNKIHSLNSGWESCPHLLELDISNNKLEFIQRNTFEYLLNLIELKLDNNRISDIEDGTFRHLPSLQRLDLSNNLISWIVENRSGAFAPLKNLNRLWLSGNKIWHVTRDAFLGLANVSQLDLSGNTIASIEENPFRSMPELKVLSLNTSALICDCSLGWIVHWLNRTSVQRIGNLSCAYPVKLRRRPLSLMSADEFVCRNNDYPQPRIIAHPEDEIVVVGENVTLHCGANSSVEAAMTFNWKLNNSRLENAVSKQYESVQGQGVAQYSDLILPSVTMASTGSYECVVNNNYGVAYSTLAHLSVFVAPSFKKTPSNVVEMVGKAARLECVAEGFPTPKISWQKDGGSEFPAAFGRRMTVMNTGSEEPFFIVDLRLEDAGVYTCTAKNDAGTISWNTTLTVLEAPSFSKQMKNKEVFHGEAAVLECIGKGSPKPNITWSRNNKAIALSKRHFLTAENQLLVITEASVNDSGSYECELSNRLGSVRNRCELKVAPVSRFLGGYEQAAVAASEFTLVDVVAIVVASIVSSAVVTSAVWVAIIHRTRRGRRTMRGPLSPVDVKSENSSHSSKDSGTGDSTKRSYQDLLLTSGNANHASIMGSHSESPSPVPESTLPLLTTFHPIPVDTSPYIKETGPCVKAKHPTPVHYQTKQELEQQPPQPTGLFCGSPASSTGIQCACLTATFKKTAAAADMCDCLVANGSPVAHQCLVNHCAVAAAAAAEHEVACYGDLGKRPCSIPVPFHGGHSMTTASCCRHHPNSYLCLYMPPAQHGVPQ